MIKTYNLTLQAILVCLLLMFPGKILSGQNLEPFIGLHGGINFSIPRVLQNYQVITPLDGTTPENRNYSPFFRNFGHQFGFSFYLGIKDHLAIGFLPEFNNYSYRFSSSMDFFDNQGQTVSSVEYRSMQRLNYLSFPVIVQYNVRKKGFTPYLFAGVAYEVLRNAQHNVNIITTLAGPDNVFTDNNTDNYSTQFIHSKLDVLGGVGVAYDFTQFRLGLDVSYRLCLNNITSTSGRYDNQTISGSTYDVSDDIKLNNLLINATISFPINKITKKGAVDCTYFKTKRK